MKTCKLTHEDDSRTQFFVSYTTRAVEDSVEATEGDNFSEEPDEAGRLWYGVKGFINASSAEEFLVLAQQFAKENFTHPELWTIYTDEFGEIQ